MFDDRVQVSIPDYEPLLGQVILMTVSYYGPALT
jgi:hypothetical protein